MFYDLLIATLSGLIGWRVDMTDRRGYACPFLGAGCNRRCRTFEELKAHTKEHPKNIRIYQKILGIFCGPVIWHYVTNRSWPVIGSVFNDRVPGALQRIRRIDIEEAEKYWKKGTEEMDDITRINEEEEQEEARSEVRQKRSTLSILRLPLQTSPEESHQVLSKEGDRLLIEEMHPEERRRVIVSEDLQIRMNQLREVLTMEDINEMTENLEGLLRNFADTPQILRLEGDLSSNDPVLLLMTQGRCERICMTELFCPFPQCHEPIRSNGALLTHLNKKHDLTNKCCRDLMHHFLHRLCPTEVYVMLRKPDGVTVDRR
jgi:hypothetical protein